MRTYQVDSSVAEHFEHRSPEAEVTPSHQLIFFILRHHPRSQVAISGQVGVLIGRWGDHRVYVLQNIPTPSLEVRKQLVKYY